MRLRQNPILLRKTARNPTVSKVARLRSEYTMHNQIEHLALCNKIVKGLPEFATLVNKIGTSNFDRSFLKFFNTFVDVEDIVVFYFPHQKAPQCLIATGKDENIENMRHVAELYAREYYKYDPNRDVLDENLHGSSRKQLLINRDDIKDEKYRSIFYDATNISEELILIERCMNGFMHLGYHRSPEHKGFEEVDINYFRYLSTFGISCLLRHFIFSTMAKKSIDRQEKLIFIRDLLSSKAPDLSPRELDVCSRIIMGYTKLGIALDLGIKECSVATMRKRSYKKMGICSQNEMFEHCLDEFVRRHNILDSELPDFRDTLAYIVN
jgi:DNA-binding CsgD family transcriptional regulator